jgi:hypothetical protein
MPLATMETAVAINALLDRLPDIRLYPTAPYPSINGVVFRSLEVQRLSSHLSGRDPARRARHARIEIRGTCCSSAQRVSMRGQCT